MSYVGSPSPREASILSSSRTASTNRDLRRLPFYSMSLLSRHSGLSTRLPGTIDETKRKSRISLEQARQMKLLFDTVNYDSSDDSSLLVSLKSLKNALIGNPTNKLLLYQMGIISKIIQILENSGNSEVWIQGTSALGSLAHGPSVVSWSISEEASHGLEVLFKGTQHRDPRVIESSLKALKNVLDCVEVDRERIFRKRWIQYFVEFVSLEHYVPKIVETAIILLARCCEEHNAPNVDYQAIIAKTGVMNQLFSMLLETDLPRLQEAVLGTLSAICFGNEELSRNIASSQDSFQVNIGTHPIKVIFKLLKDKRPIIKLLAATLIAVLLNNGALEDQFEMVKILVLPTLAKLINERDNTIKERALLTLAYIAEDNEDLQKVASDINLVQKLAPYLFSVSVSSYSCILKESCFLALAAICSLKEECRKQLVDAKLLPEIVSAMEHPDVRMRAAACRCARSLSRSVKTLRTSLIDVGIAMPLLKLLSDPSLEVQLMASASLCNMVLEFSPMKKVVLDQGGVAKLVFLTQSDDDNLRLNSVWALKNLLFQAESPLKEAVMKELSYSRLKELLMDHDFRIQEQALTFLRNLACGKEESDIEQIFLGLGNDLVSHLEYFMLNDRFELMLQAIYVVVNICTGNERHKTFVLMSRPIMDRILKSLDADDPQIRVAVVWCLINLTWPDDSGASQRIEELCRRGFDEKLQTMLNDSCLDVRDRVKTALEHFERFRRSSEAM